MFEGVVEVIVPQAVSVPGVGTSDRQVESLGSVPLSPSSLPLSLLPPCHLPGGQLFPLLEGSKKFGSQLSAKSIMIFLCQWKDKEDLQKVNFIKDEVIPSEI